MREAQAIGRRHHADVVRAESGFTQRSHDARRVIGTQLHDKAQLFIEQRARRVAAQILQCDVHAPLAGGWIGSASGRENVGQYVLNSVVSGTLTTKRKTSV